MYVLLLAQLSKVEYFSWPRMNLTIDIPLDVLAREPGGFPAVLGFLRLDFGRMYPGSLCAVKHGLHNPVPSV